MTLPLNHSAEYMRLVARQLLAERLERAHNANASAYLFHPLRTVAQVLEERAA